MNEHTFISSYTETNSEIVLRFLKLRSINRDRLNILYPETSVLKCHTKIAFTDP